MRDRDRQIYVPLPNEIEEPSDDLALDCETIEDYVERFSSIRDMYVENEL